MENDKLVFRNGNWVEIAQRYHSLDKLKAFCAFFVVCIHTPFLGVFGEYFMVLTRIAVP